MKTYLLFIVRKDAIVDEDGCECYADRRYIALKNDVDAIHRVLIETKTIYKNDDNIKWIGLYKLDRRSNHEFTNEVCYFKPYETKEGAIKYNIEFN